MYPPPSPSSTTINTGSTLPYTQTHSFTVLVPVKLTDGRLIIMLFISPFLQDGHIVYYNAKDNVSNLPSITAPITHLYSICLYSIF